MTVLFNWLTLLFTYIGVALMCTSAYKFIGGIILVVGAALQMFINFYIEDLVDKQNERIGALGETLSQTSEKESKD